MDHQMHPLMKKILLLVLFGFYSTVLFSQSIDSQKLLNHIEYLSSDELAGRKPLSDGSLAARNYILGEMTELPTVEAIYPDFIQRFSFVNGRDQKNYEDAANLVAFIPGSSSKKVIVVTAHYDHVGIGRTDAAGRAAD